MSCENIEHIKELIDTCIEDVKYAEGREAVKAETWAYQGEGAVRIVDYLTEKYEKLTGQEN